MKISRRGINFIKKFEQFRSVPYLDQGGYITVGYGHLINLQYEKFKDEITEKTAENILLNDLKIAENCIVKSVKVPISQNQFDALVSLVFNIGCGAFCKSTLLKKLNEKSDLVAPQFLRWNKVRGVVSKGLTVRRHAEMQMFLGQEGDAKSI